MNVLDMHSVLGYHAAGNSHAGMQRLVEDPVDLPNPGGCGSVAVQEYATTSTSRILNVYRLLNFSMLSN